MHHAASSIYLYDLSQVSNKVLISKGKKPINFLFLTYWRKWIRSGLVWEIAN